MPPIQSNELTILYRDDHYVAVDKPPGMIVHRGSLHVNNGPVLLQTLRDQIERHVYPVHRLDQPTSGVILFGLSPTAAAALVEQLTRRQVAKYYQTFVRGWMHREGCLRIPLISKPGDDSWKRDSREVATQVAATDYATIRWYEIPECLEAGTRSRFSLVETRPRTGRWHQIRRHLKHIAHPIIGDFRHGDDRYNSWFESHYGLNRLLLAACFVQFRHPFFGTIITIRAPRGEAFDDLLFRLSSFEVPIQSNRIPPQPQSQQLDDSAPERGFL